MALECIIGNQTDIYRTMVPTLSRRVTHYVVVEYLNLLHLTMHVVSKKHFFKIFRISEEFVSESLENREEIVPVYIS